MDDVVFEDLSGSLRVVPVLGPEAARRLAGAGAGGAEHRARARRGAPGVDVFLAAARGGGAARRARRRGRGRARRRDLEALRILAGVPRFGADVDASRLPMEAGLTRAGDLVLEGLLHRPGGRAPRHRPRPSPARPRAARAPRGARVRARELTAAGQEVGIVTSAAETPEGRLGLGYLRRAHWKCGASVDAGGAQAMVRRVLVEEPGASEASSTRVPLPDAGCAREERRERRAHASATGISGPCGPSWRDGSESMSLQMASMLLLQLGADLRGSPRGRPRTCSGSPPAEMPRMRRRSPATSTVHDLHHDPFPGAGTPRSRARVDRVAALDDLLHGPVLPDDEVRAVRDADDRHGPGVLLRHLAALIREERVGQLHLRLEPRCVSTSSVEMPTTCAPLPSTSAYRSRKFAFCFVQPGVNAFG